MLRSIPETALSHVSGLERRMRGHGEVAKEPFADGDPGMPRGDNIPESPRRDYAETIGSRKQIPVVEFLAENRVENIVGGQRNAIDFDQDRAVGEIDRVSARSIDDLAVIELRFADSEAPGLCWHFRLHCHRFPPFDRRRASGQTARSRAETALCTTAIMQTATVFGNFSWD